MVVIKRAKDRPGEDVEWLELSDTGSGCQMGQPLWQAMVALLKVKLSCDPGIPLLYGYPRQMKALHPQKPWPGMITAGSIMMVKDRSDPQACQWVNAQMTCG